MTFKALPKIAIAVVKPKTSSSTPGELAATAASFAFTTPFELTHGEESASLESMLATIEHLTAFGAATERFGLSRGLLAFADYDGALSGAIPEVPALENLAADLSPKKSAVQVAAVEAGIGDAVTMFVRRFKERLKNTIARIKGKAEHFNEIIVHASVLKEMIDEGREFDADLAKTKKFRIIPRTLLLSELQRVEKLRDFSTKVAASKLPVSQEEFRPWLAKLRTEYNKVFANILDMNDQGGQSSLAEKEMVVTDTLSGHGYSELKDFATVEIALSKMNKDVDGYVTSLTNLLTQVQATRNEPTMIWENRAASICVSVVANTATWSYWLAITAGMEVLKAIFACTKKTKK